MIGDVKCRRTAAECAMLQPNVHIGAARRLPNRVEVTGLACDPEESKVAIPDLIVGGE